MVRLREKSLDWGIDLQMVLLSNLFVNLSEYSGLDVMLSGD